MRHHLAVSLGVAVAALLTPAAGTLEAQTTYRFESVDRAGRGASRAESLFYPSGVAVDPAGAVWVSDTANHVVRKLQNGRLEIVAGAIGDPGSADGPATAARFNYPQGLAFDPAGNLYIADSGNGLIRKMTPGGRVETWAGQVDNRGGVDGERLVEATFITPISLAWDVTGELWIADYSAHTIRRIGTDDEVETISGIFGEPGHGDGSGEISQFSYPSGVDIDAQGRIWIADRGNGAIRIVTRDGFTETFAGMPGVSGHRNGALREALFDHPADLVISTDGRVFVVDSWSHTVRMIDAEVVSTIAGTPGLAGDLGGGGTSARFNHPVSLALRDDGTLFVADMLNHELREGREEFGTDRRRTVGR